MNNCVPNRKVPRFSSNRRELFLMAVPCFLFVIVFSYLQLAGWIMAFYNFKPGIPIFQSDFTGLKYFKLIFTEPDLLPVLRNTLIMSFLGIAVMPLPVAFAILLSEVKGKAFRKVIQITTTLPYFISWVLVYAIFFLFFSVDNGFINKLLLSIGAIKEPTNVLANNKAVWLFQTGVSLWRNLGFSAIIYFASIAGIDPMLYDSASIDGAGRFRTILHITIPGLIPTYITLLLLNIGNMLSNGFEQYYVFYNPMVHDHIQVIDYYLYRIGITLNDYSFSTALGMTKTLLSTILLFSANWISKRISGQSII